MATCILAIAIYQHHTILQGGISATRAIPPGARAVEFHNRNSGLPKMSPGRRQDRKIGREVHLRNCYSPLSSSFTLNRRAFLPSEQGGPCLSYHPEQPQICSWPRWPQQHLISPQIPRRPRRRRWQTYSAVIDGPSTGRGRSAKKGCGEGEGSSNGLLTRKPASSAPTGKGAGGRERASEHGKSGGASSNNGKNRLDFPLPLPGITLGGWMDGWMAASDAKQQR